MRSRLTGRSARSHASPAPDGFATATLSPADARCEPTLRQFVLDWDDARACPDPHRAALEFARSAALHAATLGGWDGALRSSPL